MLEDEIIEASHAADDARIACNYAKDSRGLHIKLLNYAKGISSERILDQIADLACDARNGVLLDNFEGKGRETQAYHLFILSRLYWCVLRYECLIKRRAKEQA